MGAEAILGLAGGLVMVPLVTVTSPEVRVGDLVRVEQGTRLDPVSTALVVLRLPLRRSEVTLRASAVASLLRNQTPGLSVTAAPSDVRIVLRARSQLGRPAACVVSARSIPANAPIAAEDLASAPCAGASRDVLRYDRRSGGVVARRDLPAGSYLGAVVAPRGRGVGTGTALTLRAVAGSVAVERAVVTLQPARSGGRAFVRDRAGNVFAAPIMLGDGS